MRAPLTTCNRLLPLFCKYLDKEISALFSKKLCSQFFSGCSFILYWYWFTNYREEVRGRGASGDFDNYSSDCEFLAPQEKEEEEETSAAPISNISEGVEQEELLQPSTSTHSHFVVNTISLPVQEGDDLESIRRAPGDEGEEGEKVTALSNNPYLNGATYSQSN